MHAGFPLPDLGWDALRPFWDGAARGELVLPRCRSCGGLVWYPAETCRHCGHEAHRWEPVSSRGRLFSWTVVRHVFLPAFADLVPFATGLVALDEDPRARLVTRLVDCDHDTLEVDQPVEVVFRPLRFTDIEGEVTAPLFRPVAP